MSQQDWNILEEYKHDIENGKAIAIIWDISDIYIQAKNDDIYNLTHNEAKRVLTKLQLNHDANIGINWDVISAVTDIVIKEENAI